MSKILIAALFSVCAFAFVAAPVSVDLTSGKVTVPPHWPSTAPMMWCRTIVASILRRIPEHSACAGGRGEARLPAAHLIRFLQRSSSRGSSVRI